MAAPKLEVVTDGDGAISLVATVDGLTVELAHVNASQVAEQRQAAGLPPIERPADGDAASEG